MIRPSFLGTAFLLLAAGGLVLAQDQPPAGPSQPPSTGGWRRVGETPPPPPDATPQQPSQSQDPTQPVDRSDAYGQPVQTQSPDAPPQAAPPPQAVPPPPPRQSARPAYGLPPEVTVKPGTYMTILTNQVLSSDHNQPGDPFSATLMQPLVVDGIVIAPRGQMVYGRVADVQRQHSDRSSRLGLELTELTLADGTQVPIRTQLVGRQGGRMPAGEQFGTVAATTGVGAAIGAAAAWGTGAAIGGVVGAAAGIIGVVMTRNHPTVLYPETALTFRMESPLTVSTVNAPQAFRYVSPDEYNRPMAPQLQPRPAPRTYYAPYAAYPYPSPYPYYYPYWGPGFSVWVGRGPGFYYGRGYYRRWR
jgi:hypothetical protein